jgi:processive 1,2-diacylglycerol beta-glucosyltransferase
MKTSPRRVLVLTSSSGAGHDTHARAFADWAAKLHGSRVDVRVEQLLEDSSWFFRWGVRLYNAIQRTAPWAHHLYYQFVEALSLLHGDSVAIGRDYYIRILESFQPDVILSVHDCLNRGYFPLARRVVRPAPRCVISCFEYQGGYGCSRNWVERAVDLFIGRTADAAVFGVRGGIPAERCKALGNLLPPRFYSPRLTPDEKARYLQDRFGFTDQRFTLLLSTGGAGAQNHIALLDQLLALDVQVIALCGRGAGVLARVKAWSSRHPGFHVRALPFTDEMPVLLQLSSAVVARAGVSTTAEAVHCGCVPIFNALRGVMPQEIPAIRHFQRLRIGAVISRAAQLRALVERWLADPEEFRAVRQRVANYPRNDNPARFVAEVLGETSESTLPRAADFATLPL